MVNIILVEKTGELKSCVFVEDKDELYKKCKFKKAENFVMRTTWNVKQNKYAFKHVSLYARDTGVANTENKYDFPPPVDNILYFGCCALVAHNGDNTLVDLSLEVWPSIYEDLFGGFENLADTIHEDENEEDELENIPAEMKTKSGYLKDGFVVDDHVIDNDSSKNSNDDDEWEDISDELEHEEYSYSDED
jgi:hypothetical protein